MEGSIWDFKNAKLIDDSEKLAAPDEDELHAQLPESLPCSVEASGKTPATTIELRLKVSHLSHNVVAASYANDQLGVQKHFVLGNSATEVLMALWLVLHKTDGEDADYILGFIAEGKVAAVRDLAERFDTPVSEGERRIRSTKERCWRWIDKMLSQSRQKAYSRWGD